MRTAAPRGTTNRIKVALFGLFAIEFLSALAIALLDSILIAVVVAVLGPVITIALFKRRPILVIAGFIGMVEFGLGSLLWLWGACRLARPESAWAKAFYRPGEAREGKAALLAETGARDRERLRREHQLPAQITRSTSISMHDQCTCMITVSRRMISLRNPVQR